MAAAEPQHRYLKLYSKASCGEVWPDTSQGLYMAEQELWDRCVNSPSAWELSGYKGQIWGGLQGGKWSQVWKGFGCHSQVWFHSQYMFAPHRTYAPAVTKMWFLPSPKSSGNLIFKALLLREVIRSWRIQTRGGEGQKADVMKRGCLSLLTSSFACVVPPCAHVYTSCFFSQEIPQEALTRNPGIQIDSLYELEIPTSKTTNS